MNAASRTMTHGGVFSGTLVRLNLTREMLGIAILMFAVLTSAFTVIYVKNLDRRLFSDIQVLQQKKEQSQVEWGQLLLEQSTWAAPARIQHLAADKLDMVAPAFTEITMVSA